MIVSVVLALVIECRCPARKRYVLPISEGLAPAARSREPTLAAVFYWKGPVEPIKRGPPLQLDVVEDRFGIRSFWKEPSGQLSLGLFQQVDNFEGPSSHQFLLKWTRLKVTLLRARSGR